MPSNLTDSDAFTTPVVAPIDTEAANAASLVQGLQPLANRTKFLRETIFTRGVPRLRQASAAGMQALTGVNDGDICEVYNGTTYQGAYVYDADSAITPPTAPRSYAATGMGVGQWVHFMYSMLGHTGGIPFVKSILTSSAMTNVTTTSTSETTLLSLNMGSLIAGDLVFCPWQALASCTVAFNVDIYVNENGGADALKTIVNSYAATPSTGSHTSMGVGFFHVVGTGGTFLIKIKGRTTNVANQLSVQLLPYIIQVFGG